MPLQASTTHLTLLYSLPLSSLLYMPIHLKFAFPFPSLLPFHHNTKHKSRSKRNSNKMATPYQGNILYYPLPNGTLIPILDINGQYVPASTYSPAIPVNITATFEPIAPAGASTTATTTGHPSTTAATATAAQSSPQQQLQQQQQPPPPCVLMFLQMDGTYGLKPDHVD
ncbi:unnamed protein product [Tuber aestivum]|uniref:Uncharacterized protein n=1 Tax=Tuber aestivum TaxID=59557 RepID=A0A292PM95_9PEZI|nr:unnamed protein product [Tuber aestivum]